MKILISGASGLVGTELARTLRADDHEINTLTRKKDSKSCCDFHWDPDTEQLDLAALDGVEAVIHLAGENIAGRWTTSKKARIRESRINGTRLLRNAISDMENKPRVFVCASGINYYGDRGDEQLNEESEPGAGFLAEVCREWEAASILPSQKGVRVVNVRMGMVLSEKGGALAKMLLPFKLGVGGVVGDGNQYWSWVAIEDVIGAITHALKTESLKGAVNIVAPRPVTNREFTKKLGKVLSRPTILPMPAPAVKIAFGDMGEELLLASIRVDSSKLTDAGYRFVHPELEKALRDIL